MGNSLQVFCLKRDFDVFYLPGRCVCQQGFTGPRCDRPCPKGFYGVGCKQACLPCTSGMGLFTIYVYSFSQTFDHPPTWTFTISYYNVDNFSKIWTTHPPSIVNVNCEHPLLQVTFSEKGTKITPQTHIWKFEILHFSDSISKITMIQKIFCWEKCTA